MRLTRENLKSRAHGRVKWALEKGLLPSPKLLKCVFCGKTAKEYDHRDYRYPLLVHAVCRECNQNLPYALPHTLSVDVPWAQKSAKFIWGYCEGGIGDQKSHAWDTWGNINKSLCGLKRKTVEKGKPYFADRLCKKCVSVESVQ